MYKIVNGIALSYVLEIFKYHNRLNIYNLSRSKLTLEPPSNRTENYKSSFAFTGVKFWNSLPDKVKQVPSLKLLYQEI